jgi:hypothetical protein
MKKIVALSIVLIGFMGCKKDDPKGEKPVLTFKSVSSGDVAKGEDLLIYTFELKDGNGDYDDRGAMYVFDQRLWRDNPNDTTYTDVFFPRLESHAGTKINAELQLYASDTYVINGQPVRTRLRDGIPPPVTNPDTMQLRVFVLDDAGNSSDTLILPKVAIHN